MSGKKVPCPGYTYDGGDMTPNPGALHGGCPELARRRGNYPGGPGKNYPEGWDEMCWTCKDEGEVEEGTKPAYYAPDVRMPKTKKLWGKPRIVCLCGSTRFYDAFCEANFSETMKGNIVLSVGFYPHQDWANRQHGQVIGITPEQKIMLDELHKRKIDLADEVLVLNIGGYVGESTRSEIEYAKAHGKPVRWLEVKV